MFANELRHVPLRDLDLGGWKSSQTIVQVYQHPDVEAQRTALAVAATTTPPSDEAQAGRVLHGRGGIRTRDTGLPYTRFPVVTEELDPFSSTVGSFDVLSG
jgi:hypothetical protein